MPYKFVYAQTAGSGSYGSLKAWTTTGGARQGPDKLVPGEAMGQRKPVGTIPF